MSIGRSVSPQIYIIADDLSGAADAGVSFLAGTRRVRICLDTEHPWDFALGIDTVQVLLTDTRKLSAAASSDLVERVLRPLRGREGSMIYQKIDSTMRGTVGAEIEATLKTLGRRIAVLTPTFPQTNRVVVEGRLLVEGRPVTLTQYANDPRDPIRYDAVKDIVAETSSGLKLVNCGPGDLLPAIHEADRGQDLICVVVDSETEKDLETIAAVLSQRSDILPVGSAGLAKHLASRWIPGGELVSLKLSSENRPQRVLIASGSANPRSHAQIRELVRGMRVPFTYLDAPNLLKPIEGKAIIRQTTEHLLESEDRIIGVALTGHRVGAEFASGLEEYIGRLSAAWLNRFKTEPVAVVAFGADTCVSVCRESGISVLWPQGEILPGIPLNQVRENVGMVTKAGGFGSDDALVTIARFLTGIDPGSGNEPGKKAQEHRADPIGAL